MVEPIINTESLSYYDKLIKDFIENHNYELKKFKFEDLNMVNPYFKEKIDNNINSGFLPSEVEFKTPNGNGSYTCTVLIYWLYDNNMLSFTLSGNIVIDKDEETNEEYIFGTPLALDKNYDEIIPEGKGFKLHSFITFMVNGNSELEELYQGKKFIYLMDGGSYDYLKDFKNYIGNVLSTYFTQLKYLIVPRDSEAIENNIPIFYTEENPDEPDNPTKGLIKDSGKKFNDTSFIKFNYLYGAYYDSTVEEGRVPIYTKETFETLKSGSIIYSDINCTNRIGSIKNVLSSGDVELNIEGKTEIVSGYLTSTYETYSNDLIPTEKSVYNYIQEQGYTNDEEVKNIIENKLGTDKLSTKVYSLVNYPENTQFVYSLNSLSFAPIGTIVYQDKDCTVEYGKITSNMSGTLRIDTDPSITWALNGSEDYVSDKRIATEAAVKNYVDDTISEKVWDINSNANDYTTSGIYKFAGWRKSQSDNLPITNYDEDNIDRNNIAFTLVVNTKDGYLLRNNEGNVTRNIPTMIAQTLMLVNRRGSDTKIYTRHGQIDLNTNTTTWGEWKEVMTSTYLGVVDSYAGDVLNSTTEIGLYTGAMVNMASNTADVFKLEVINNYAVTTQVSAATGTSVPNSVLQTITILNLDGSNTTKKRIGTYNGSGYTWSEWKENTSATPDWNQNDENAADYIKNRTHYEYISEHKELTDEEYHTEIVNGKTFTPIKLNSINIDTNEFLKIDSNIQVGVEDNYNKLFEGIYLGNPFKGRINSTGISPMIAINGKTVKLNWFINVPSGASYTPVETPDGLDSVFYGINKVSSGPGGIYIYADGFILKDYGYAEKFNGVNMTGYQNKSSVKTFLIDKSVYGEAPYTIDFYFEHEQTIKKIDEKFLPDYVKAPKYKRGDVVYYSNYNRKPHFGVMPFEDYKNNPTNSSDTRSPIGLVVDPVKRTFIFTDLINYDFTQNPNYVSTYLDSYTSHSNGAETAKRLSTLSDSVLSPYFPAFYDLAYMPKSSGCFYMKQKNSYIPSLQEWEDAYSLCCLLYDPSPMDTLIALRDGLTEQRALYVSDLRQFYAQVSSVASGYNPSPFNIAGEVTQNFDSTLKGCPVFGIYTEDEENNYPEF